MIEITDLLVWELDHKTVLGLRLPLNFALSYIECTV